MLGSWRSRCTKIKDGERCFVSDSAEIIWKLVVIDISKSFLWNRLPHAVRNSLQSIPEYKW